MFFEVLDHLFLMTDFEGLVHVMRSAFFFSNEGSGTFEVWEHLFLMNDC